jgi:hypothetical protein
VSISWTGVPPALETFHSPRTLLPLLKTMVPSGLQAPPQNVPSNDTHHLRRTAGETDFLELRVRR